MRNASANREPNLDYTHLVFHKAAWQLGAVSFFRKPVDDQARFGCHLVGHAGCVDVRMNEHSIAIQGYFPSGFLRNVCYSAQEGIELVRDRPGFTESWQKRGKEVLGLEVRYFN
jgi:hypothetical protein